MSFNKWPKRSAEKNYFMVPNEIFSIGLDFREISLYSYLLRCENRKTYQCYPSYKTIGHAIGMSENTVAKYVRQLEEKGLIYTEPTMVRSKDGRPLNGNLLYTVRPIQGVLEAFYERQLRQVEEDVARYHAAEAPRKVQCSKPTRTPRVRLSEKSRVPAAPKGLRTNLSRFRRSLRGQQGSAEAQRSGFGGRRRSGVTTDFSPFGRK
ncbi:MAG: helix-turn-helix domain-containing protein [Oscillospiraceae bacterium]